MWHSTTCRDTLRCEYIARVACPTLVVNGKQDKVVPLANAYRFLELIDEHAADPLAKATAAQYPAVSQLFDITYFGGWDKATPEFFGNDGLYTKTVAQVQKLGQ